MGNNVNTIEVPNLTCENIERLSLESPRVMFEDISQKTQTERKTTSIVTCNIEREKKIFNMRLKHKNQLVYCYGFELMPEKNSKRSGFFESLYPSFEKKRTSYQIMMYYESVTQRFSDLYTMDAEQGLRILANVLQGYSVLFDHYGYFRPQMSQIMRQGDVWKVWISSNPLKTNLLSDDSLTERSKLLSKDIFCQQIVHLFDALRDQNRPGFSYTQLIYMEKKCKTFRDVVLFLHNQNSDKSCNLQNNGLSSKSNSNCQSESSRSKISLKRISQNSLETVKRKDLFSLHSFQNETSMRGQETVETKFFQNLKNTNNQNRKISSMVQHNNKQASLSTNNFLSGAQNNNSQSIVSKVQRKDKQLQRVSSKLIYVGSDGKENMINSKSRNINHHRPKIESFYTASACTTDLTDPNGRQRYQKYQRNKLSYGFGNESPFRKRERSMTVDFSENYVHPIGSENIFQRTIFDIPVNKITENSESNSAENSHHELEEERSSLAAPKLKYEQSKVGSQFGQFQGEDFGESDFEAEQKRITQINNSFDHKEQHHSRNVSNSDTIKTPSIAKNTLFKQCGGNGNTHNHNRQISEEMKSSLENEKLMAYFQSPFSPIAENKAFKYCLSQEFDSAFFGSVDDYKSRSNSAGNITSRKLTTLQDLGTQNHVKNVIQEEQVAENLQSLTGLNEPDSQAQPLQKVKRVARFNSNVDVFQCSKNTQQNISKSSCEDFILQAYEEMSNNDGENYQQKIKIFRSEGGLNGLMSACGTLKSIKRIDVDLNIDEEILNDLNKKYQKHRFTKSTQNMDRM